VVGEQKEKNYLCHALKRSGGGVPQEKELKQTKKKKKKKKKKKIKGQNYVNDARSKVTQDAGRLNRRVRWTSRRLTGAWLQKGTPPTRKVMYLWAG